MKDLQFSRKRPMMYFRLRFFSDFLTCEFSTLFFGQKAEKWISAWFYFLLPSKIKIMFNIAITVIFTVRIINLFSRIFSSFCTFDGSEGTGRDENLEVTWANFRILWDSVEVEVAPCFWFAAFDWLTIAPWITAVFCTALVAFTVIFGLSTAKSNGSTFIAQN